MKISGGLRHIGFDGNVDQRERLGKNEGKPPEQIQMGMYPCDKKKRGRTKAGIIIAINKRLECRTIEVWNKQVMEAEVIFNEKKWRILIIYSQNIGEIMEHVTKEMDKGCLILDEDLNARTGGEVKKIQGQDCK